MKENFQELKNEIYKLNEQQKNDFIYGLMGSLGYYFENEHHNIDKKTVLESLSLALKNSKGF